MGNRSDDATAMTYLSGPISLALSGDRSSHQCKERSLGNRTRRRVRRPAGQPRQDRPRQDRTCHDHAATAHRSQHITGVYVPPPLSPGATKDSKGQEGQCTIGCKGARQQQLQRATATASWRRTRAQQIKGVYVLPPMAPSMMSEAAKADILLDSRSQQQVQWADVIAIR